MRSSPFQSGVFFQKSTSIGSSAPSLPIYSAKAVSLCGVPPCRLYIPRDLLPIYLDYVDFLDHEPLTRRVFVRRLKKDAIVLDVGANIGYYTLLAARNVGPNGRVHSVECSPDNLAILAENVRRNKLENVEIHPFAAASKRGTITLNVSAVGLSWFGPNDRWPAVPGRGGKVTVPAVPMNEIIKAPVDLVKIDAEGLDLDVLKGMRRTLYESPHVCVIVEWAPPMLVEAGKDPLELPRWLEESGFSKIEVLDQYYNERRSMSEAIRMLGLGNLPSGWTCDLAAQR